jgi:hypothetical protein
MKFKEALNESVTKVSSEQMQKWIKMFTEFYEKMAKDFPDEERRQRYTKKAPMDAMGMVDGVLRILESGDLKKMLGYFHIGNPTSLKLADDYFGEKLPRTNKGLKEFFTKKFGGN